MLAAGILDPRLFDVDAFIEQGAYPLWSVALAAAPSIRLASASQLTPKRQSAIAPARAARSLPCGHRRPTEGGCTSTACTRPPLAAATARAPLTRCLGRLTDRVSPATENGPYRPAS
ncbi:hypothetical protein OHA88_06750 [Streptomyces sp. NBC_00353]|uniref:hypothetical protein n=1 Tax=Streptomyces sp. NBC_00353 TaxID=2975722 RepID=UPI002E2742C6